MNLALKAQKTGYIIHHTYKADGSRMGHQRLTWTPNGTEIATSAHMGSWDPGCWASYMKMKLQSKIQ